MDICSMLEWGGIVPKRIGLLLNISPPLSFVRATGRSQVLDSNVLLTIRPFIGLMCPGKGAYCIHLWFLNN